MRFIPAVLVISMLPAVFAGGAAAPSVARVRFDAESPRPYPYPAERVGVCSWSWATNMTTIVSEMDRMGVKCMQLSLVPWVKPLGGIDYPKSLRETFGLGETGDVFAAISNRIARGEISVLSTMISFPNDCWGSYRAITNSNGIVCNADLAADADGETVSAADPLGVGWWTVCSNLVDQSAAFTRQLGVEYLSSSVGFLMKPMYLDGTNANANGAIGLRRLYDCQRLCAHHGVKLLLETGQYSGAATMAMIDLYTNRFAGAELENGIDVNDIALNFDLANHVIYENDTPTNAFLRMRSRIPQVHIKDTFVSRQDRLGAGGFAVDVKWGTADVSRGFDSLAFLKAQNYRGNALVEHEAGSDRVGDIRAALTALLLANNDDPEDPWIDPEVMAEVDADERCGAALRANGFSAAVSAKLATTGLHGRFRDWARSRNHVPAALVSKDGVILAAAYNASEVPAPGDVRLRIENFEASDEPSFEVVIDGTSAGFDPAAVDRDLLTAALDIRGAESLTDGFSAEGLSTGLEFIDNERVRITVCPEDPFESFFFAVHAD